jgi:predicted alpha/beta hydrolase
MGSCLCPWNTLKLRRTDSAKAEATFHVIRGLTIVLKSGYVNPLLQVWAAVFGKIFVGLLCPAGGAFMSQWRWTTIQTDSAWGLCGGLGPVPGGGLNGGV